MSQHMMKHSCPQCEREWDCSGCDHDVYENLCDTCLTASDKFYASFSQQTVKPPHHE